MSDIFPAFASGLGEWMQQVNEGAHKAYEDMSQQIADVGDKITPYSQPLWSWGGNVAEGARSSVDSLLKSASSAANELGSNLHLPYTGIFGTSPPPPPPSSPLPTSPFSLLTRLFSNHSPLFLIAVGAVTVAIGGYWIVNRHPPWYSLARNTRTKALKTCRGERKQVVVLIGEPSDPLTALAAWDLNVRGYIVYVTAATEHDAQCLACEESADIRPLPAAEHAAAHLERILALPVSSSALMNAPSYQLELAAIVLLPGLEYPDGPLEAHGSATRIVTSIQKQLTAPLTFLSTGGIALARKHRAHIIIVTPAISMALNPGFYSIEALCASANASLALSLHRELRTFGVHVVNLRLGLFDLCRQDTRPHMSFNGHAGRKTNLSYKTGHSLSSRANVRADMLSWPEPLRQLYSRAYDFTTETLEAGRSGRSGEKLERFRSQLHLAIAAEQPPRVIYAGRHARLYGILGQWLPESVVTRMLNRN